MSKPLRGGNKAPPKRIVVLGVGNVLLSDEGVGVHVAKKLLEMELPPGVQVVEGGTDGFRLMNVVTEADRLIIVDAVKGGEAPGSIYRFDIKDAPTYPDAYKTSVHQIGILEVVHLSELVGKTPETTIIGVEPKSLDMGMELSPEVEAKLPRIIELVFQEVNHPALPDNAIDP
ncbi:MAG: HyaD/HybD family hydrogenase maturation endopeptidase [Deltaproteobacteria bacterium]|nr:HyaD/HybD family hydrogenase maturation endopeptidase [Deltaproteobacteria bacterium]MBW2258838.1 HyaD/HybD family hydrogenase maturation endopeptidase [Deltaproteobacteria bacterium]